MTFFIIACGGEGATDSTADTQTEEPAETPTPEKEEEEPAVPKVVTENASYKTVIIEDGIASPRKEMTGNIGEASIIVNYGSPSLRGRELITLTPHDKLWRTGANMATTIEVSKEVMIEGKKLSAGKYAIFTIPGKNEWVVAFNKDTDQGGTRSYDEAKDALRINVKPVKIDKPSEAMEFIIEDNNIALVWGDVKVPFSVS